MKIHTQLGFVKRICLLLWWRICFELDLVAQWFLNKNEFEFILGFAVFSIGTSPHISLGISVPRWGCRVDQVLWKGRACKCIRSTYTPRGTLVSSLNFWNICSIMEIKWQNTELSSHFVLYLALWCSQCIYLEVLWCQLLISGKSAVLWTFKIQYTKLSFHLGL